MGDRGEGRPVTPIRPAPPTPAPASTPASVASARIIRGYFAITFLFNLAMSLIWGIDTLFKMNAGLDIRQVLLTNAAFTLGSLVFQIPTGVVADTLGRRTSLLLCLVTLFISTLLYVGIAWRGGGFRAFLWASALLGLGFTFYTGAVDAWLVDALRATGYGAPLDRVFARGHMYFGAAMLLGTIGGGLLGQIHLYLPYLVRAGLVIPLFWLAWVAMPELGYTRRALNLGRVPAEMRRVLVHGLAFALRHPVLRPVMGASFVAMSFMIFGFYSWQRYFLDLLGRDLVWVDGVISSLVGLSLIAGNALVGPLTRVVRTRPGLLMLSITVQAVTAVACGLGRGLPRPYAFYVVVTLYLVYGVAVGVTLPVKQAFLNDYAPSAERATILSLDSMFADGGGVIGQAGWGWVAARRSIGEAWSYAGATLLLGLPLYWWARRSGKAVPAAHVP
jgi:MFS family permease